MKEDFPGCDSSLQRTLFFFLQIFTVIFALSIATTIFNKRVLGFPQAIGVPIVSAIFVFILQWGASLLSGNQFITINIHNIEEAVRHIDFYDFLCYHYFAL